MRNPKTGRFLKGNVPWTKGKKGIHHSPDTEFKKGQVSFENNPHWKGDNVGIPGVHDWVKNILGKPNKCENCGFESDPNKPQQMHWANISGKYKRDLTDWIRLCRKCHWRFDRTNYITGKLPSDNTSGFKGVSFDKSRNKWIAYISIEKKFINLGRFSKIEDAIIARKNAVMQYYNIDLDSKESK